MCLIIILLLRVFILVEELEDQIEGFLEESVVDDWGGNDLDLVLWLEFGIDAILSK